MQSGRDTALHSPAATWGGYLETAEMGLKKIRVNHFHPPDELKRYEFGKHCRIPGGWAVHTFCEVELWVVSLAQAEMADLFTSLYLTRVFSKYR